MKPRRAKRNSANFWPKYKNHLLPRKLRATTSYKIQFLFTEEGWFDPTNAGPLHADGQDWNKLGGITCFNLFDPRTYKFQHNAALIGFRPGVVIDYWQTCLYVNDSKGNWDAQNAELLYKTSKELYEKTSHPAARTYIVSFDHVGRTITQANLYVEDANGFLKLLASRPFHFKVRRDSYFFLVGPSFGGTSKTPNAITLVSELTSFSNKLLDANPTLQD